MMQHPRMEELKLLMNLKTTGSQHRGIHYRNTFKNPIDKVKKNLEWIVKEMLVFENKVKTTTVVGSQEKQRFFNIIIKRQVRGRRRAASLSEYLSQCQGEKVFKINWGV